MDAVGVIRTKRDGGTLSDEQVRWFIDAYTRVHGRPPAEADLQRHFRVSPPAVHRMVLTLERAGLIRRQPGLARSIGVLYGIRMIEAAEGGP